MIQILSTLSNDQNYTTYKKGLNGTYIVDKVITIKGKANISNKNLITPKGVLTSINDEDLVLLEKNSSFQTHKSNKFITVLQKNEGENLIGREITDKEIKNNELEGKDQSSPNTPDTYKKQGKKVPKTKLK
ncbi:MAG: hypothetical protein LBF97_04335 [Elusimicrobiota bacterium]|jgi:hypothetical protein|nr:hypothetical protein [Elusimicrobiota bacterium]